MKKKIFLLPCIAAVAIATYVGAKSFKTNASESNNLLLANVEALSSELDMNAVDDDDDDPCAMMGQPLYSLVATTSGMVEHVVHFQDGNDDDNLGLDKVYTISFTACIAKGSGSLKGFDGNIEGETSPYTYQECKGAQGHHTPDIP